MAGRAPTTPSRACGAICSAAPTSARSSCRASRTATAPISIASSASTRTSGSSRTSASTASSRDRNRRGVTTDQDSGEGVDRLGRQQEAPANVDHEDRRRLSRRPRFRATHGRHPPVLRWRLVSGAGSCFASAASGGSNRTPARGSTTIRQASSSAASVTSPIRRRGTTARTWNTPSNRASRRSRDRSTSRRASRFQTAATTGRSTCCCSKAITARRCRDRFATPSADSGAARSATCRPACSIGRTTGWCSTSACRSPTSRSICRRTEFTTTLVNLRTGYSFSSNMFLDTLLQYRNDVKQFSANVRFNLIHRPLSDFFIVYNESQFTDVDAAGRPRPGREVHADVFVLGRGAATLSEPGRADGPAESSRRVGL